MKALLEDASRRALPPLQTCSAQNVRLLQSLLCSFGLRLEQVDDNAEIPGSYWGAPEAGLVENVVYVRADTPLHSALHEAAHAICMDDARRARLHTDAGGDYAEETAVCYLQIILAARCGVSARTICSEMDAWGYTFRLGSAYAWFVQDAEDALTWLVQRGLLSAQTADYLAPVRKAT